MTKANQITLDKTFYFHKWKDSQDLIFKMVPELEPVYNEMVAAISMIDKSYDKRNNIINVEVAKIFNGQPIKGAPINR